MPFFLIAFMKNFSRMIIAIFVAYLLVCMTLSRGGVSSKLMFHPPKPGYSWQSPGVIRLDGDPSRVLAAIWLPNSEATKALLYFHGNAEDIANGMHIFRGLHDAGFSVLAVDYPGFGMSDGRPTESSVYASAEAAYAQLTETFSIAPSNIVVLGLSIGSGPACYLAEKHKDVGGLVIHSGFTSAFRVVTRIRLFPIDPFPNLVRMAKIECPKLFLHGTRDEVVPYQHGVKLFSAASEPKFMITVDGAGHDDLPYRMGMGEYFDTIRDFAYGVPSR